MKNNIQPRNEKNINGKGLTTYLIGIIIISLAIAPSFVLGKGDMNLFLVAVLGLSPFIIVLYKRIYYLDVLLVLFMISIVASPLIFHPESMRWSTVMYSYMFALTFIAYNKLIHRNLFSVANYIKLIFSFVSSFNKDAISTVPKVIGSCLLLRMEFLKNIGYLDENTFLYAEEPILSAQVKQHGGKIAFTPFIEAVHAHIKSEKGNNSKRMLLFIKSRKYYLKQYSGYNALQLGLLNLSYALLALLHALKSKVTK